MLTKYQNVKIILDNSVIICYYYIIERAIVSLSIINKGESMGKRCPKCGGFLELVQLEEVGLYDMEICPNCGYEKLLVNED